MTNSHRSFQSLRRELIIGAGTTLVFLGIFAAVLLLISQAENQKTEWVTVSLIAVIVGWLIVRTQTTGFLDTLKVMLSAFLSLLLSPVNWF